MDIFALAGDKNWSTRAYSAHLRVQMCKQIIMFAGCLRGGTVNRARWGHSPQHGEQIYFHLSANQWMQKRPVLAHIKACRSASETYRWIKVKASIYLSALRKTDYSKRKRLPWFPCCPNRGVLSAAAFAPSRLPCQSAHWWTAYLARTNHIWLLSVTVNYTPCASCPPAAAQWQRSHLITAAERWVCWGVQQCSH